MTNRVPGLNYYKYLFSSSTHAEKRLFVFLLLLPRPLRWCPKEALSLPDRQGINPEADTDQLWQSSASTSALSAQRDRCPSRLSGQKGRRPLTARGHWTCRFPGVSVPPAVPLKKIHSKGTVLHLAFCLQPGFRRHWCLNQSLRFYKCS